MERPTITHQPSQVISNTLPLNEEGRRYLGIRLSAGLSHGLNIKRSGDVTNIHVLVSFNITSATEILFQFQTVKSFQVNGAMDDGATIHIACDFMTIATDENHAELLKVESIFARNQDYPKFSLQHYYPIASAAFKRFVDGTDKFPTSNN